MRVLKKGMAVLLALTLVLCVFTAPAAALGTENGAYSFKERMEHRFYQTLDGLIVSLGAMLNTVIPGFNWIGKIPKQENYTPEQFYPGKDRFDAQPAENADWKMGFSAASFLDNIDPMSGEFYLAGSIAVTKGNVPQRVLDDQGVNTFALSDGTTTITHSTVDGFGLARGDVIEIRRRLAAFAKEHGIAAINVSTLHQHSCLDTLGLGAPLLPAGLKNPASILFGGKAAVVGRNPDFMEEVYRAVTKSVMEAVETMQSGTLSFGSADVSRYVHDKRDPQAFDGFFHRLRFVPNDPSQKEIWVGQICIHPVTIENGVLSADYPHYIEQYVKEHAGADLVLIQGAELAISSLGSFFSYEDNGEPNARAIAMGETLGKALCGIQKEKALEPLLNVALREVAVHVTNPIHIIAGREGLLASVMCKDKTGFSVVTELGYLELGGVLGAALVPGEIDPAILWGGAVSKEQSWMGTSWDYAPWAEICGAERLICFGLCNDQIGYLLCDNDYRSMLTENEEINAVSRTVGSQVSEAFEALIASVKG